MNKLHLIVWGVPMYPIFLAYIWVYGRCAKGRWPTLRHAMLAINHAYREHWHGHDIPLSQELRRLNQSTP